MTVTPKEQAARQVAYRLATLRRDQFGEHGGPLLAMMVGVSHREWYGYETGKPIPKSVLKKLAELTDTPLEWLLTGQGGRPEDRDRLDLRLGER